jgi:UDP-N-acetylglucosamine 4,6-dehydratase/5-epimerase
MTHFLDGKSLLITGGTGSLGQALAKYILENTQIARLIIFSRDEWKQWQMRESPELSQRSNIRFFLGDVRDEARLRLALHEVNYVVHAAALKQVPAAEYNPSEFVKTNVTGAMNISNAAIDMGVDGVIALSSDKAVNPINLYGATKLCSDKLLIAANAYVGKRGRPRISIVRYGNVLGSRGSILPLWQSLVQKKARALPITDMNMTRFWITLPQAVEFVLMALQEQTGGEIFVPKSPSVYIPQLAEALYPGMPLDIIGIRPGEKLHETLISSDYSQNTYEYIDHYRIAPSFSVHKNAAYEKSFEKSLGKEGVTSFATPSKVSPDFYLASNHNSKMLTSLDEIKKLCLDSGMTP